MRFTILLIIPVLLTCKGFAQDFHDRHFTDTNHLFLNIVTDKGAHQYVSPDLRGFANFSQEHFELKSNLKSFIPRGPYSAPGLIKNLFLKDSLFDDLTILIFFPEDQDLNMEDFEGQKIKMEMEARFGNIPVKTFTPFYGFFEEGELFYSFLINMTDQFLDISEIFGYPGLKEIEIYTKGAHLFTGSKD